MECNSRNLLLTTVVQCVDNTCGVMRNAKVKQEVLFLYQFCFNAYQLMFVFATSDADRQWWLSSVAAAEQRAVQVPTSSASGGADWHGEGVCTAPRVSAADTEV